MGFGVVGVEELVPAELAVLMLPLPAQRLVVLQGQPRAPQILLLPTATPVPFGRNHDKRLELSSVADKTLLRAVRRALGRSRSATGRVEERHYALGAARVQDLALRRERGRVGSAAPVGLASAARVQAPPADHTVIRRTSRQPIRCGKQQPRGRALRRLLPGANR